MNSSLIRVYNNRHKKWEKRAKVVLGWTGIINSGMSDTVYTNTDGLAIINHRSTGVANVYINGTKVGKIQTPGNQVFYI